MNFLLFFERWILKGAQQIMKEVISEIKCGEKVTLEK
jgi:hypothetical protein